MHAEIVDLTLRLDKAPPNVRADDSEVIHARFVSSVPAIYVYTCVCDTHARTNAHTHDGYDVRLASHLARLLCLEMPPLRCLSTAPPPRRA